MKKILLDTNIVLDFLLEREPFFKHSDTLLKASFEGKLNAYISATTVTDIYYITRKVKDHKIAISFIKNLLSFLNIANVGKNIILNSLNSKLSDFEDAIQENTAIENNIDIIITRNEKDFINSELSILTPNQYIKQFL